mmetsp:Transcript_29932/g.63087  ORF Transcript_29932/g.63087 Transcript_29932/m.63087 type:complete len:715 (+) Transcript_29932:96-2240(+)
MTESELEERVLVLAWLSALLLPWSLFRICAWTFGSAHEPNAWQRLGFSQSSPIVLAARARSAQTFAGCILQRITRWDVLFVLLLAVYGHVSASARQAPGAPFDPYETLQLASQASEAEIRSAYRKMAAMYHPDKNPDPEASARFIQISRAYTILSDARARANYEKYGSPDGPQARAFNIVLPSWLASEEMFPLLLLLVLLIPIVAIVAVRRSGSGNTRDSSVKAKYLRAAFGLSLDATDEQLRQRISAARAMGAMPQLVSVATLIDLLLSEAPSQPQLQRCDTHEMKELRQLQAALGSRVKCGEISAAPAAVPDTSKDAVTNAAKASGQATSSNDGARIPVRECQAILLHAHLHRLELSPSLRRCQFALLLHSESVLHSCMGCASGLLPHAGSLASIVALSAALCQAVHDPNDEKLSLLQVPHFSSNLVDSVIPPKARSLRKSEVTDSSPGSEPAACASQTTPTCRQRGKKSKRSSASAQPRGNDAAASASASATERSVAIAGISCVSELVGLDAADRATLLESLGLSETQASDAAAFCALFPRPSLSVSAKVAGEEDSDCVYSNDGLTVTMLLTVSRGSLQHASGAPPAHAPRYPVPKGEAWLVVLADAQTQRVIGIRKPPSDSAILAKGWACDVQFNAGTARTLRLEARAVCAAYLGANVTTHHEVEVMRLPLQGLRGHSEHKGRTCAKNNDVESAESGSEEDEAESDVELS